MSDDLWYYRARIYDPRGGRFLGEDPLRAVIRTDYAYANNNPLINADPSGLVTVTQKFAKYLSNINAYYEPWNEWHASGTCRCENGVWYVALGLEYTHEYRCESPTSRACGVELHHATIASAWVAKWAQQWNKHESIPYSDRDECLKAAWKAASDLQDHANDWYLDPTYRQTQQWFEDTHHGLVCTWFPEKCGAY